MTRLKNQYPDEGFFGIGILNNVNGINIGTLWRSAYILGASFIFTIDKKYQRQSSDVTHAWTKIPLYHYETLDDLKKNLPFSTPLVGVELDERAVSLAEYKHPQRAVYLLGNEKSGLPPSVMDQCHSLVKLPGNSSLNVSVAGSILLYDRHSKMGHPLPAAPKKII